MAADRHWMVNIGGRSSSPAPGSARRPLAGTFPRAGLAYGAAGTRLA